MSEQELLDLTSPPHRVVSLVPSLTESLFDLGLGSMVVGCTDYCVFPAAAQRLPHVGGPKDARLSDILALKPDLVLASRDENSFSLVSALQRGGVLVWTVTPHTVRETIQMLWRMVGIFRSEEAAQRVRLLEEALERCEWTAADIEPWQYFCPIWQDEFSGRPWWMTFNQDTYCNDLLRLFGGQNVFAQRQRHYPLQADLGLGEEEEAGERDVRYPRVGREEVLRADPQVILLPSEPFAFAEPHRQQIEKSLARTRAVRQGRIHFVDGSLLTWSGTRLGQALMLLPEMLGLV
ncbi:MAG: ABC transporter substrate-binding protein [Longilinea sp.]|nr:ABC transporter substrate-binding protein [Longilinea sp.]MCA1954465.1 helical backbone metal receptor [Anaerolinea sp.]